MEKIWETVARGRRLRATVFQKFSTTEGQWFDCSPSSLEIAVLLPNCLKSPKYCQQYTDSCFWRRGIWCFMTSFVTWPVNSALLTGQQFFLLPTYSEVAELSCNSQKCTILIYSQSKSSVHDKLHELHSHFSLIAQRTPSIITSSCWKSTVSDVHSIPYWSKKRRVQNVTGSFAQLIRN